MFENKIVNFTFNTVITSILIGTLVHELGFFMTICFFIFVLSFFTLIFVAVAIILFYGKEISKTFSVLCEFLRNPIVIMFEH